MRTAGHDLAHPAAQDRREWGLSQDCESRQIRLYRGVVTTAVGVPAACSAHQSAAGLIGGSLCGVKTLIGQWQIAARPRAHMAPQLQTTKRRGRHLRRRVAAARRFGPGFGGRRRLRFQPLPAPHADGLAGAAQLRVTQRHGDARQLAGFAERRVPTLLLEELLNIDEVAREHPRARRERG